MEPFQELIEILNNLNQIFRITFEPNTTEAEKERILAQLSDCIDKISLIQTEVQEIASQQIIEGIDEILIMINDYHNHLASTFETDNNQNNGKTKGRPKISLDKEVISQLKKLNMSWSKIAKVHGISIKTLQRRRREFRSEVPTHTDLSDNELDTIMRRLVEDNPNMGERLFLGTLVGMGHRIKRWRLRASLKRIDPTRNIRMIKRRIRRRVYNVRSPNALW